MILETIKKLFGRNKGKELHFLKSDTDQSEQDFLNALVKPRLYSLGEVLDDIEYGMFAISVGGVDKNFCFSIDKEANIFNFDGSTLYNSEKEDVETYYAMGFKKFIDDKAPKYRFLMYNNINDYLNLDSYEETKEEEKI